MSPEVDVCAEAAADQAQWASADSQDQQNLYHCPNRRTCNKQFRTLAAAVNHLESERCGFMTFNQVQHTMGNLIGSDRRLTF